MKKYSVLLLLFIFVASAASAQMWKLIVDHSCIPKDFDPKKYTLLVMHLPNRNNLEKTSGYATKSLQKAFEKNYPYKFEIVTPDQLRTDSVKYSDTSIYKFILLNSFTTTEREDGGYKKNLKTGLITPNPAKRVKTTTIDFAFYDFLSYKQYPFLGARNSFVGPTIEALTNAINEVTGNAQTKE